MRGERLERYWKGYMSCSLLSVPGCGWWGCHFFWHQVSNQNARGSTSAGQLHSSSCVTRLSGLSIPSGWPRSVWVWRNQYTSCYGYSWEGDFWESFPRRFDTMNMTVLLNRNELVLPFTKMVTVPCQSEGQCQEVISDQSFQRKESSPSNSKTTPEYNESSTCFGSPLGEREARLLWVEACRSVTTQGSHKCFCLGGQSTKLFLLTTSHRKVKRHRLTSWGSYVNLWGDGELHCMLQQFLKPAKTALLHCWHVQYHQCSVQLPELPRTPGFMVVAQVPGIEPWYPKICVTSWKGSCSGTRAWCSSSRLARTPLTAAAATDCSGVRSGVSYLADGVETKAWLLEMWSGHIQICMLLNQLKMTTSSSRNLFGF